MSGWEAQAEAWIAWAQVHDDGWSALRDLLPPPGRATLDVGCGEGRHVRALTALGHRAAGLEPSPALVAAAQAADPDGDYRVGTAENLPFPDDAFDLLVSMNVLGCVDDLGQAVAESARVLEPGGHFCFSIPHPLHTAVGNYFEEHRHEEEIRGVAFVNVHRPLEAYVRALADAGLAIADLREPRPVFLQLRAVKPRGGGA